MSVETSRETAPCGTSGLQQARGFAMKDDGQCAQLERFPY